MLYQTENQHGGDIYGGGITLDFSANTNPLGTPPSVLAAITQALPQLHRYPDPYCRALVKAIAEFHRIPESYILCGNGAAELIYACCAAIKPQIAVEPAPAFAEYTLALAYMGSKVERYLLRQDSALDLDENFPAFLEKVQPELVFLCNPNNPTGRLISPALLKRTLLYCRETGTRLLLDECFLDLSDDGISMLAYLRDFPQLLILKAFTKSYGMAGVRLGYCLCADSALLEKMAGTSQPWNVSALAQAAGVAALRETEFLRQTRTLICTERPWLAERLMELGFWGCPSKANYLLLHGPEGLEEALRQQGIAIRNCANYHGLGDGWYRIAVRRHEENELLLAAIKQTLQRSV